ncbi:MAG: antibiotic biosynthesis monooxygenase [Chloroflexi bacterium]|nr:antibiotic biosynthesis monooxygenase [Chloroflexota bacterium]
MKSTEHNEEPNVIARVVGVEVPPDQVEPIIGRYRELVRPIHASAPGLRRHYVLSDRSRGRISFVGIWESDQALADVVERLEPARKRLWDEFGHAPMVDSYAVEDELG